MKNQVRAMNEKDFVEAQKENVFQAGVVKLENERGIKMSDITPQAGDVWKHKLSHSRKIRILFVADEGDEQVMSIFEGITSIKSIKEICGKYNLIERDGKPYVPEREFEAGEFYPVIYDGYRYIARYWLSGFSLIGFDTLHSGDGLKIGPKLEIDWDWAEVGNE